MHLLELFTSEHCPGSPAARRALEQFCAAHDMIRLQHVDVADAPGKARAYGLIATPATVIDGRHVVYGVPRPEVIRRYLTGAPLE